MLKHYILKVISKTKEKIGDPMLKTIRKIKTTDIKNFAKKKFENPRIRRASTVAGVVVALGAGTALAFATTTPYALNADGEKVKEPWAVMAGNTELVLVETKKDGKAVIEGIKESYKTEGAILKSASIDPKVTVVEKDLDRGEDIPTVTGVEEAVEYIVKGHKDDHAIANVLTGQEGSAPFVYVTTVEKMTKSAKIKYKVIVKESDDLVEGEKKVKRKGKKGEAKIVSKVTKINGEVVATKIIEKTVTSKAVSGIIVKGTGTVTDGASYSGSGNSYINTASRGSGSRSGNAVVDFACQFVGNPYVYGGTSLTNGADCSGFVMSVYAHFGVSLPHSSGAIASCGRSVSYSEARPGDILCYPGHVGIYIGGGQIVHASTPSSGIKIGSATYRGISSVRRIF